MFHIFFYQRVACNKIPLLHSSLDLTLVSTVELPMDRDQITGFQGWAR